MRDRKVGVWALMDYQIPSDEAMQGQRYTLTNFLNRFARINYHAAFLASFACKNFRTATSLARRSTASLSSASSVLRFKPSMISPSR